MKSIRYSGSTIGKILLFERDLANYLTKIIGLVR